MKDEKSLQVMDCQSFRITVAKNAGSCFGVNRALKCVYAATGDGPLFTFGPLIHNPRVIQKLADAGVHSLSEDEINALPSASHIVLRAHGTAPQVVEALKQKGFELIDATCPFVKKAQEAAASFASKNLEIVITGEEGHPEIESLLGFAPRAHVVGNSDEADKLISALRERGAQKEIGLLSQTTQSKEFFSQVERALKEAGFEVEVANTICEATKNRQADAYKLAKETDVMLVLGGRNSANTTRLAELCAQIVPTYHIESPAEITSEMIRELQERAQHIGITAGASTPASQIQELVDYLNSSIKRIE